MLWTEDSYFTMLIDDWSGVDYLWIIAMFLSAVWTLILMAPVHCRGSIEEHVMIDFSKSVLMKKQTHLHLGWPEGEYTFSKFSFLGVKYYFKRKHLDSQFTHTKIPVYHEEPGGSILLRVSWWFLGREDPDEVLGCVPVSHSRNAHSQ